MAERRITEKTGRGVVCFISNYSWLDGLSFTGMRERYLEAFDAIRIDNLHGDRIISKYAPDGRTSETVMAIQGQSLGIKVGTAITQLSKSGTGSASADKRILYRDFHEARADERRRALLESLDTPAIDSGYSPMKPNLGIGLPLKPTAVSDDWYDWPSVPDLFPTSFRGVKTSRDSFLVDIDFDKLKTKIQAYFDSGEGQRAGPDEAGFVRYAYRPFDTRWLYWEANGGLLDRPRPDYKPHVFDGNLWLVTQKKPRREWSCPQVISSIGCIDLMDRSATCIPAWVRESGLGFHSGEAQSRPNLSPTVQRYLERVGAGVADLFHHAIAVLHGPRLP